MKGAKFWSWVIFLLGVLYFIVIIAIAVAAIPLLIVTNGGQG